MRKDIFVLSLTFALLLTQGVTATPKKTIKHSSKTLSVQQIARLALPSIVRLTVLNKEGVPVVWGSGIVVGNDLIATNIHVIRGAHAVTANFQNGRSEPVYGAVSSDDYDLVLLRAFTQGVRPLSLASTPVEVGEPVVAVGSPEGYIGSVSTGIVSGIRFQGGAKIIQTTAPISHGSSGGALLDMHGRVIGVTSFTNVDGQNLNFAYAAYYVRQMISHQFALLDWKSIEDYARQHPTSGMGNPGGRVADTGAYTAKPLSGIKEVVVIVEPIDASVRQDGLDAEIILSKVKARLLSRGIPVVASLSSDPNKPGACYDVIVNTLLLNDNSTYAYSLGFDLSEFVYLRRPVSVMTLATTWASGCYGTIPRSQLANLQDSIDQQTDKFIADFNVQNPK